LEAQEWKLHTDIIAFENELRRFTARYHGPFELRDWYPQGRFFALLDQFTKHPPRPMVDRALQITLFDFRLQKRWPWIQVAVPVATFLASRISYDRTVIVVRARSDVGQSFIDAFLQRCQELWDATPLRPVADTSRAVDAGMIAVDTQQTLAGTEIAPQPSSHAEHKQRIAQLSTAEKLDRLRVLRRNNLKANRVDIAFTTACNQAAIDPKTVREHAPELRRRWDDPTYVE
jgi:hypothetical protein